MHSSTVFAWLLLLASAAPVVEAHDGAAATITVAVLLLLLFCCTSICWCVNPSPHPFGTPTLTPVPYNHPPPPPLSSLSGVGLFALCRGGGVKDYDPESEAATERRMMR